MDYSHLGDLRVKLDQMAERIIERLKDRSRFPQNLSVYRRGGVKLKGAANRSFLEFALEGLETYHASLGRFEYPDQAPLVIRRASSKAIRKTPEKVISDVSVSVKDDVLKFYTGLVKKVSRKGEDPTTFGETAYCDADLLELLNERIGLGKFVAESKLRGDPRVARLAGDRAALMRELRNLSREKEVVAQAKRIAKCYGVSQSAVGALFKWIIDETLKVEAEYLRRKFARG